jgi:hypothetical protein
VKKIRKVQRFTVVLKRDEDGFYVASIPALQGCHTQGRSLDQAKRRNCGWRSIGNGGADRCRPWI